MRYIERKKIKLSNGEELDTGNQILVAFITPKIGQQQGADYEQQKLTYKAIEYLRSGAECAIELGYYIALEDAWYEHLMHQMKHWPWGINDPSIYRMILDMENAPDIQPLQLVKPNLTPQEHFDGVSVVPSQEAD